MKLYIFLFTLCLSAVCLYSCNKSNTQPAAVLSTEEFIRYTVNGNNYSFIKQTDKVFSANYLNNPQPPPTTLVYGERIPNASGATANIEFERTGVTKGSTPILKSFYTLQTADIYPYYTSSSSQILINITEYGNVGEYISGNFSGLFIGSAPSYNQYNVTCFFRVKRVV